MENNLNEKMQEYIKREVEFLESDEMQMPKNEHGVYLFISQDGSTQFDLPYILAEYKQFLIDNQIVKLL